jgi:hypothetical protein
MKTFISSFTTLLILLINVNNSKAQVNYVYLSSAKISFLTPSSSPYGNDDKDHDTQIGIQVNGAYGAICSLTRYSEDIRFPDNDSYNDVQLPVVDPTGRQNIGKDEFAHGRIQITIFPNGHDTWIFKPTIYFYFSDGTSTSFVASDFIKVSQDSPTGTINF